MTQVILVPSLATIPTGKAQYVPQEGLGDSLLQLFAQNQIAVVNLAGGTDTGGGLGSWLNPQATEIVVSKIVIRVTAVATGACTLEAGTTTVSAVTASANSIDTVDVHTAAGVFSTSKNPGANGKPDQLLAAGGWVTFSTASGASAGLVAKAYIHYMTL